MEWILWKSQNPAQQDGCPLKKQLKGIVLVSEKCFTASVLYKLYKDESLFLLSIFLKNILKETQSVNKVLQAKQNDLTKILNDLHFLILSIAEKIYVKEHIAEVVSPKYDENRNFDAFLIPHPYLGYEFENLLKQKVESNEISQEQEDLVKSSCINFIKDLVHQLRKRLPKNIEILKHITKFSTDNALKQPRNSIVDILENMKLSHSDIDLIENQWNHLTQQQWKNTNDTTSFWIEVQNYKDAIGNNPFRQLSEFALSLLVLPFSNADVERLFSTMGLVKPKLRK